jgi:bifunctional non-homologous end joining protein LigD
MSPVGGAGPFDDDEWFFEPWWPGAQAIVYVESGRVRLQTDHMADPNPAFLELGAIAGQFGADRLIAHGTLLVLDDEGRPDAELLRRRLGGEAGIALAGFPALVVSDLLHVRGDSLLNAPFEDRRAQLTRVLRDGDACVVGRGLRTDGTTLAEAAAAMGMTHISARRLSARYRPGASDDSWRRLPVAEAASTPARPFLALLQRLPL